MKEGTIVSLVTLSGEFLGKWVKEENGNITQKRKRKAPRVPLSVYYKVVRRSVSLLVASLTIARLVGLLSGSGFDSEFTRSSLVSVAVFSFFSDSSNCMTQTIALLIARMSD